MQSIQFIQVSPEQLQSEITKGIPSLSPRSLRKCTDPFFTRLFQTKSPEMKNINAMKKRN